MATCQIGLRRNSVGRAQCVEFVLVPLEHIGIRFVVCDIQSLACILVPVQRIGIRCLVCDVQVGRRFSNSDIIFDWPSIKWLAPKMLSSAVNTTSSVTRAATGLVAGHWYQL
jgi:hypothetical protein